MKIFDSVATKLDIREFSDKEVPKDIKLRVLEAARLSSSGINSQHWRFILVQSKEGLKKLAEDSTTGKWVANSNFAVMVLTNPKYNFHLIDAGRVAQNMQLVAWEEGVASCVFTGIKEELLRKDFNIPNDLYPAIVVGFGYPKRKVKGRKNRKPIDELVFIEKYGNKFDRDKL
jgi:nitroreductase